MPTMAQVFIAQVDNLQVDNYINRVDHFDLGISFKDGSLVRVFLDHRGRLERMTLGEQRWEAVRLYCGQCGGVMFFEAGEVAHHGSADEIDYDTDADHVAIAEVK